MPGLMIRWIDEAAPRAFAIAAVCAGLERNESNARLSLVKAG
jgi:hypothetical protein